MKQENRLFSGPPVQLFSVYVVKSFLQEKEPDSAAAWIVVVETGRYHHPGMFCLDCTLYTRTTKRACLPCELAAPDSFRLDAPSAARPTRLAQPKQASGK